MKQLLPLLLISALNAEPWTLERCISAAVEKSIAVQMQELSVRSEQIDIASAQAQLYPNLTGTVGSSIAGIPSSYRDPSQTLSMGLNSRVTLFDGFRPQRTIRMNRLELNAENASAEQIRRNAASSAAAAWMTLQSARENSKICEDALKLAQEQTRIQEAFLKAGRSSESDLLRAKAEYAQAEYTLTTARQNSCSAELALRQLLFLDTEEPMEFRFEPTETVDSGSLSADSIFRACEDSFPAVGAAKLSAEAAEIAVKIARTGKIPVISANGSVSSGADNSTNSPFNEKLNDRFTVSAGVSITVPIIDNRQSRSALERAEIRKAEADLRVIREKQTVLNDLQSLVHAVESAKARFHAAKSVLAAETANHDRALEQARQGTVTPTQFFLEENRFRKAEQELMLSGAAYRYSRERLAIYTGSFSIHKTDSNRELQ